MAKFYDTCAILTDCSDLSDVIISSKTIEELENIKVSANKDTDIKYKARMAVRAIKEQNPKVVVVNQDDYEAITVLDLEVNNDNLIIACAARYNRVNTPTEFYTEDYLCGLIASTYFDLTVKSVGDKKTDEVYTGYKTVTATEEELAKIYEKDNCENIFDCLVNEYVIINDGDSNFCDVLRWTGDKYAAVYNKNIKSMAFGDKIKAKDIYQRMAIDSLMSNQITCISGHAGSGKSLLSLVVAMNLIETGKYDRLVVLFNPVSVKGATQLGYYSGSAIEKALQSNIGHILTSKFGDKFATENYIAQGKIKLIPMADCRGCEISDNEILWITEAENTTADLMKICLSRVSSGAKVIIEGDYEQTDDRRFDASNGLRRAVDVLCGEAEFGYVELRKVWRSRIAELVNKM